VHFREKGERTSGQVRKEADGGFLGTTITSRNQERGNGENGSAAAQPRDRFPEGEQKKNTEVLKSLYMAKGQISYKERGGLKSLHVKTIIFLLLGGQKTTLWRSKLLLSHY